MGQLDEKPVRFALTEPQRVMFDVAKDMNKYLRQQHHSIHDILHREGVNNKPGVDGLLGINKDR